MLASIFAPAVFADTYTYTGDNYIIAQAPYTTSMSITGSFTIATLAPNLPLTTITPTSFSFFDGINNYLSTDPDTAGSIAVSTDPSGGIGGWNFTLTFDGHVHFTVIGSKSYQDFGGQVPGDFVTRIDNGGFHEARTFSLGTWEASTAVPEPSAVFLMATAVLASGFLARKRMAWGLNPTTRMKG